MSNRFRKLIGSHVYMTARRDGFSKGEAALMSQEVMTQITEIFEQNPYLQSFFHFHRDRLRVAEIQRDKLKAERDALLNALATTLNISESEAWLIASLDIESGGDNTPERGAHTGEPAQVLDTRVVSTDS